MKQNTNRFFEQPWLYKNETQLTQLSAIDLDNAGPCDKYTRDVASMIAPTIKNHLKGTAYDITGYIAEAIREKDPDYQFDSYEIIQKYDASNCIGLSLSLLMDLVFKFEEKIPPIYVIPATLPKHYGVPMDVFGHVALLIVCRDGLILLDSGFHIHEPIMLYKDKEYVLKAGGNTVCKFYWDGGCKIKANIFNEKYGLENFEYTLKHISNPDAVITQSQTGNRKRISYVTRDGDGTITKQVTINRTLEQVEAQDYETKQQIIIPFSEVNVDTFEEILSFLPEKIIARLRLILRELLDGVESIKPSL